MHFLAGLVCGLFCFGVGIMLVCLAFQQAKTIEYQRKVIRNLRRDNSTTFRSDPDEPQV